MPGPYSIRTQFRCGHFEDEEASDAEDEAEKRRTGALTQCVRCLVRKAMPDVPFAREPET